MAQHRNYPRNAQSRHDALGVGHRGPAMYPRNDESRRDALAIGLGDSVALVAATGTAASAAESDIVTGGKTVIFTITGNDFFKSVAHIAAEVIAGLDDGGAGIVDAMAAGDMALSAQNTVLTVTLPAVAAYDISSDAAYDWTLPASVFNNRNADITFASAVAVTNEA